MIEGTISETRQVRAEILGLGLLPVSPNVCGWILDGCKVYLRSLNSMTNARFELGESSISALDADESAEGYYEEWQPYDLVIFVGFGTDKNHPFVKACRDYAENSQTPLYFFFWNKEGEGRLIPINDALPSGAS